MTPGEHPRLALAPGFPSAFLQQSQGDSSQGERWHPGRRGQESGPRQSQDSRSQHRPPCPFDLLPTLSLRGSCAGARLNSGLQRRCPWEGPQGCQAGLRCLTALRFVSLHLIVGGVSAPHSRSETWHAPLNTAPRPSSILKSSPRSRWG